MRRAPTRRGENRQRINLHLQLYLFHNTLSCLLLSFSTIMSSTRSAEKKAKLSHKDATELNNGKDDEPTKNEAVFPVKFTQDDHDFYVPDGASLTQAWTRTTHLGIGAHQDDLEFMALHGILHCFHATDYWFSGVTCTDGAGSARAGPYALFTDAQMKAIRRQEQKKAAQIGHFGFMVQLNHPSAHCKSAAQRPKLVADLREILRQSRPEIVYTHNPFDKHASHVGVLIATLEAILSLPPKDRPQQLWGCEVWRGLDWLPDEDDTKLVHDVSARPNLAASLNGVFDSQIAGGKRYDAAVEGRRRANATFHNSHTVDDATHVQYAVDLSELIAGEKTLQDFCRERLEGFHREVFGRLDSLSSLD